MQSVRFSLWFVLLCCCLASPVHAANITTTFEGYVPSTDTYVNYLGQGIGVTGFHAVDGNSFVNIYDDSFGEYWEGWSISNVSTLLYDTGGLLGFENQYAAAQGVGAGGSATYAIAHTNGFFAGDSYINLAPGTTPVSVDLTNSAYGRSSMLYGDGFAKQFSADDNDFFRLEITGHAGADSSGATIGSIEFFLAQTELNVLDILINWETVDLTSLAGSQSLSFHLTSSDLGDFGMNTPAYFALDNFVVAELINQGGGAPEPACCGWVIAGLAFFARRRDRRHVG